MNLDFKFQKKFFPSAILSKRLLLWLLIEKQPRIASLMMLLPLALPGSSTSSLVLLSNSFHPSLTLGSNPLSINEILFLFPASTAESPFRSYFLRSILSAQSFVPSLADCSSLANWLIFFHVSKSVPAPMGKCGSLPPNPTSRHISSLFSFRQRCWAHLQTAGTGESCNTQHIFLKIYTQKKCVNLWKKKSLKWKLLAHGREGIPMLNMKKEKKQQFSLSSILHGIWVSCRFIRASCVLLLIIGCLWTHFVPFGKFF